MPRTRSKNTKITASVTRKVNYTENSDSSDDDQGDPGLLTNLLGLLMNMQRSASQKKNRRKTTPKGSKRKQATGGCDCPRCSLVRPKKRCTTRRAPPKSKSRGNANSTFATPDVSFNLESDDDVVADTNITETQETAIKNKVDTFFKALDSDDDDELESKSNTNLPAAQPAEKKSKDFYTILTDSEDEQEKPSTSTSTNNSFAEPSTSGLSNNGISGLCSNSIINTGLKMFSQTVNKIPEKKPEDLFAFVDEILNDCDIVDITSDKPKENIPEMSLEDLKKKTDEIVGGVQSYIDNFKSTPKEPETKTSEKEAPTCPICLETLGGSAQTMATFCGHMFCEPCIAQVARTSKKCPTCRKGVTKTKYHPVYI